MANVENLGTLERRVSVALSADEIERQVDERLKKLARQVRMPGFRPGKVPLKLIAQTYGPQVRSEVLGDAVQKGFSSAVKEANLIWATRLPPSSCPQRVRPGAPPRWARSGCASLPAPLATPRPERAHPKRG